MSKLRLVVYDPPAVGFPYLAVLIMSDGTVKAEAFDSLHDAESHILALTATPSLSE